MNEEIINVLNELIDKYEKSEQAVIYEFSGNIKDDMKALENEVSAYRAQIKKIEHYIFQGFKYEDKEPTNISDLLEE